MSQQTFTLQELAEKIGADIQGDSAITISGLAPISSASAGHLTYLTGSKYAEHLANTKASAVILEARYQDACPVAALVVPNAESAFARIAALFQTEEKPSRSIHPSAVIASTATLGKNIAVGPNAVIGEHVTVGDDTVIFPGVVIGDNCVIGSGCKFYPNVTLYHQITVGDRVTIHGGTVIGSDGFGYAQDASGWLKIPQIGRVIIGNDVEIGANTAIDRGALEDTIIRDGVKIDNLVQIAHNVEVGEGTAIAGCVGVAGSAKIGAQCMIGGASNINGHISIADGTVLTGSTNAFSSIEEPDIYACGINARQYKEWGRTLARLGRLDEMAKRLKKLERVIDEQRVD